MAIYHFYSAVAFSYFLLIPSLVLAQPNCNSNHGVVFTFPTTGDVFNYGDVVNVSWTSGFTNPLLYTFCSNSTSSDIQEQLTTVASFDASLLVQLQWPNIDNCFFDLRPNTSACYGANSPTFNVIQQTRAPTTLGLVPIAAPSSSTITTSALTTSTGTTTSKSASTLTTSSDTTASSLSTSTGLLLTTSTGISTTSTGTVPATVTVTAGGASSSSSSTGGATISKSSSGLSSGAKTGIGVGVALGAVAVIAGLATFFLRRRRNTAQGTYEHTGTGSQDQKNGAWYGGSNPQSPPGQYMYMQPLPGGGIPGEQKSPAVAPPVSHELQAEPERIVHEMSPESAVRTPAKNRFSWQQTPR